MYNMIGKTRLYTKLVAAARAKQNGADMVDFKKMAEKARQEKEQAKPAEPEKQEPTLDSESSREEILDNLLELASLPETTEWEKGFCRSVRSWLGKSKYNLMSFKQQLVYDRLVKDHLGGSPVPTRDNRNIDREYKPSFENRNAAKPKRDAYGFDDMDDDIPF